MKTTLIVIMAGLSFCTAGLGQDSILNSDYLRFGRKEPASLGGSFSDLGTSYVFAWAAPNLSISSARHTIGIDESNFQDYTKELLKFSFGFSNTDLNYDLGVMRVAAGMAAKWMTDKLTIYEEPDFDGDAFGIDLGFRLDLQMLSFELIASNINRPQLGDTDFSYARSFSFIARYRSPSGFIIAAQTISSTTYAGSDFGINLAAQQAFLNQRLISRIQLTSFFNGTEAVMQNISGNIGYRPEVPDYLYFLQDFEFSYTMSFLAMPQTVGTHMLVLTKYF